MVGQVINLIAGGARVCVNGKEADFLSRGKVKKDVRIMVGDFVDVDLELNVITQIMPRHNELVRPAVANVDQLFICLSVVPKPDLAIVDKMIILAQKNGITPFLCVTKSDIVDAEFLVQLSEQYSALGVKIISVSAKNKQGLDLVLGELHNKISAFAGLSGVGKSTLINSLFESFGEKQLNIKTGELTSFGRGRNTTTSNQIYRLGDIIIADTAGFSALSLGDNSPETLMTLYPDIYSFAQGCKYKSCSHYQKTDDECGVMRALNENKLSRARFDRYMLEYLKATERYKIYDRKKRKGKRNV